MLRTSVVLKGSRRSPQSSDAAPELVSAQAGPPILERLLMAKLAGTAQRRLRDAAEIRWLASSVDHRRLALELESRRLLPLLGSRLVAAAPASVPPAFHARLEAALAHGRRRAALVEQLTLPLVQRLERAGIAVVPLKGPHLAERVHGDAGMRTSNDIDLLVLPEDFHCAVAVLERTGYRSEDKAPWIDGLPLFEASLHPADAWRPPIDLHWRLHWYEERFSRDFIRRSRPDERGLRAPRPLDEIAALLLFWCRDGLIGLRHEADIGAWWDRYGAVLAPYALDEIVESHPRLLGALTAAALRAQDAVGLPAGRLLSTVDASGRRVRRVLGHAAAASPKTRSQAEANIFFVDVLLTPRGGAGAFLRRHLVLPEAVIADVYALPPTARLRRRLRRGYYALRVGAGLLRGIVELRRGTRRRQDPAGARSVPARIRP